MSIKPRGFININACCWWNSLIQALLSCTHFVSTVLESNDSETLTYKTLKLFVKTQKESDNLPADIVTDNISLLRVFLHELKREDINSFRIMASGQQSVSEGFTLLLDILKSESINNLFLHSYEQNIIKADTRASVSDKCRTTNNFFSQFDEADLMARGLKECLLSTTEELKDYKPKNCLRVLKLKRISPIFVVMLNKYKQQRTNIELPETIVINHKKGGTMVFYKKAAIDHSGSMAGGHYVARGSRISQDGNTDIFLFNDSSLHRSRLNTVKSTYLTFFESITKNV